MGTPIYAANLRKDFQALLQRAELPPMRFHDLRHSCSTFLGALDVDLKTGMKILGHTNSNMTLHYTHVLDEQNADDAHIGKRFGSNDERCERAILDVFQSLGIRRGWARKQAALQAARICYNAGASCPRVYKQNLTM